jgi:hypothetical protein
MPALLQAINDYLIAQAIVRDPRTPGAQPPLWVDPPDNQGVPAPGEAPSHNATEVGPDVVVGLFTAPGVPTGRHNGFRRIDGVDFWIRVRDADLRDPIEKALRAALHDKRGWVMGGLYVAESLIYRELDRLPGDPQGFTYILGYTFQTFTQ